MAWRGIAAVAWGVVSGLGLGCVGSDDTTASENATGGTTGSSAGGSSSGTIATETSSSSDGAADESTTGRSSTGAVTGRTEAGSSTGTPDPFCGDGIVDRDNDEECDDGDANSDTAACLPDCTVAQCGDGFVQEGVEECDDANDNNSDGCTDMCIVLESCGDSKVQPPEQCDDGDANADNAGCKSDCQLNVCGDGDRWFGREECDDGNEENNDTCTTLCAPPVCGDGFVQTVLAELCDDGDIADGDECNSDCFSAGLWTVTQDGPASNNDAARGVAIDGVNNIVVVGEVFDVVQGTDIWVRSYNGNGIVNWTQTYHAVSSDNAYGVAVAPNDDIYVAGSSFTPTAGRDIWLRRYSSDGTPGPIYTENGDADTHDVAYAIAVDPTGDLLVAGYVTTVTNGRDIWLRKYTTAGTPVWTRTISSPGTSQDEGHGVATDANGGVIVTGFLSVAGEARDIWVRKYDTSGDVEWTDTVSGTEGSNDEGNAAATDADNNVIVTGFIDNGAAGRDIWIRKYDPDGAQLWTRTFNAPQDGTDSGEDVSVDTDGNIVVAGSIFRGTQQDNVWLGKYDPDGEQLWTMEYNNSDAFLSDSGQGVAVDSEDNVAVVGFETRSDIGEARNIWIRYVLQ